MQRSQHASYRLPSDSDSKWIPYVNDVENLSGCTGVRKRYQWATSGNAAKWRDG